MTDATLVEAGLYLVDLTLLVLATIRATRFVLIDSLGQWWITGPALKQVYATRNKKAQKYVEGLLSCPFCIGYWISLAAILTLALAGGPGDAAAWWRIAAGSFALSYLVGHAVAKWDY